MQLGYRYLETDLRATADGVVLVFHDATLDRVTDRRGRIRDLTWREVSAARIGGREQIPTLVQVLEEFPGLRLNVDVKGPARGDPVRGPGARTRCHDRLCVASFGGSRLRAVRSRLGPVAGHLAVPVGGPAARERPGAVGVPYVPPAGVGCAQLPERLGRLRMVDAATVAAAHRAGLQVHVWTVDDAASMHRLLDLGVDGIMTDRPTLLRAVLEQRGTWA